MSRRSAIRRGTEPLRDLRLPEDVRFIAGFLHETLDLDRHRDLLSHIENLVGREVDVAQMRHAAALIESER